MFKIGLTTHFHGIYPCFSWWIPPFLSVQAMCLVRYLSCWRNSWRCDGVMSWTLQPGMGLGFGKTSLFHGRKFHSESFPFFHILYIYIYICTWHISIVVYSVYVYSIYIIYYSIYIWYLYCTHRYIWKHTERTCEKWALERPSMSKIESPG